MLKRSFAEFHAQKKLPEKQQLLMIKRSLPTKHIECIKGEPAIEDYYDMYMEANEYNNKMSEAVMQSPYAQSFLVQGRVVVMKSGMVRPCLYHSFIWFINWLLMRVIFTGHRQFTRNRSEGTFQH
jgi:superfamily II RNA helicase